MNAHLGDRLADIVFTGILDEEARAHLEACAHCRQERDDLRAALSNLAVERVEPPAGLRARVLAASAWEQHLAAAARLVDLSLAEVAAAFRRAWRPENWEAGPVPGLRLFHFAGGLATAGADVGLIAWPAGTPFPRHTHTEHEAVLVLSGGYTDDEGRHFGPGDLDEHGAGTVHSYVSDPEEELVFALVLRGEVVFG